MVQLQPTNQRGPIDLWGGHLLDQPARPTEQIWDVLFCGCLQDWSWDTGLEKSSLNMFRHSCESLLPFKLKQKQLAAFIPKRQTHPHSSISPFRPIVEFNVTVLSDCGMWVWVDTGTLSAQTHPSVWWFWPIVECGCGWVQILSGLKHTHINTRLGWWGAMTCYWVRKRDKEHNSFPNLGWNYARPFLALMYPPSPPGGWFEENATALMLQQHCKWQTNGVSILLPCSGKFSPLWCKWLFLRRSQTICPRCLKYGHSHPQICISCPVGVCTLLCPTHWRLLSCAVLCVCGGAVWSRQHTKPYTPRCTE